MDRNEDRCTRVQLKCIDRSQSVEHTAQLTLPDYRCEISRLLWVRPTLTPPTRFTGGGKTDLSGRIGYDILYVGADGALYGAKDEDDYAFSIPTELPEGFDGVGSELSVQLTPEAVISRVTGPRKLSVRCRLRQRVCGYAEKDLAPRFSPEVEALQQLSDAVECGRLIVCGSESFDLTEHIQLDGEGDLRLISAAAELLIPEVNAGSESAFCRGEAEVKLLLCRENVADEEKKPFAVTRRIPFEQELAAEGLTPDVALRATGTVHGVDALIDGNDVAISLQATVSVEGQCEACAVLCRDAFAVGYHAECRTVSERLWRAGECGNRNFSVSEERSLSELGISPEATPLFALADAELTEHRAEDGRTTVLGEVHCHVLYEKEGEYGVAEFALPFRTHLSGSFDEVSVACSVPVFRVCEGRERGSWRADAEVQLSIRAASEESVMRLAEATLTPSLPQQRADVEICYPREGENLWEVAKRYAILPENLALANGISADQMGDADSLAGVKYLMIP